MEPVRRIRYRVAGRVSALLGEEPAKTIVRDIDPLPTTISIARHLAQFVVAVRAGFRGAVGIVARRLGDDSEDPYPLYAVTDERGRFVFEGLSPGDYELFAGSNFRGLRRGVQIPRFNDVLQTVSVANGTETTVTLQLKRIDKDN